MECQNISDRRRIFSGKIKNRYKVVGVTFAENWSLIILRGRKQQRNDAKTRNLLKLVTSWQATFMWHETLRPITNAGT